jgi:protein-disulfide isomerase
MTSQHENPSKKAVPTRPARPGVQRRDWAVVAVVAVIAMGLGVYLLARPSGTNSATDNPVLAAPAAASTSGAATDLSSVMSDHPSMGAAPPGMTVPSSTTASGHSTGTAPHRSLVPATGSAPTSAAVSVAPVPSDGAKATKIGPFGDLAHRIAGDPLAEGSIKAPVVMVMFSDFRCPFCAEFSRTTEPVLVKKYVDTGILRIEWRDFPIFGAQSTTAAIAGRAAAAQGRFFPFTQAVYAVAPQTGHPDLSAADLVGFARKAGVPDIAAFAAAMNNPAAAKAVAADLDQASNLGVPSTPAFVINGYPLLGAQPLAEFTSLIDKLHALS